MTIADSIPLVGLYLGAFAVGYAGGYILKLFRRLAEQAT